MGEHESPDDTIPQHPVTRVSRALSERLKREAVADIAFRTREHAVNKARIGAYRVEYGQARGRENTERMAAIHTTILRLIADSRRLLAENRKTIAQQRWRSEQAASTS